jgi:phosphopantothenoylcysteine decarboxylase/phosphopantothenate--cysteine ligase
MLQGKKVLVGISGGIAAYKIPYLVRLLVKNGAEVKVIMTPGAAGFVTPLTLSTVSKNPVFSNFFNAESGEWHNHVELGLWADVMVIAPVTANTLAKMAGGQADNLLLATYMSAKCPVMFAPAMDLDMYQHPATRSNIDKLVSYGNILIPAASGELASGLTGEGRLEEPEKIFELIRDFFFKSDSLSGKKIIVTAGPTYEAIDPVRFIGNHSSGKMGIDIADELASRGAEVVLVCGPSSIASKQGKVKRINVTSSDEMYTATTEAFTTAHAAILAAAVADYKPREVSDIKIKKKTDDMKIDLVKTHDILAALGEAKKQGQILVGFALETNNELENAKEKLARKNLDFIVLNSLNNPGAGFKHATNQITIVHKNNKIEDFELKSKSEVAKDIVNTLAEKLKA